jgi:hypothetical protein
MDDKIVATSTALRRAELGDLRLAMPMAVGRSMSNLPENEGAVLCRSVS